MIVTLAALAVIGLCLVVGGARLRRGAFLVAAVPVLGAAIWIAAQLGEVTSGVSLTQQARWAPQLGLSIDLRLDGLAATMSLGIAAVGVTVLVGVGASRSVAVGGGTSALAFRIGSAVGISVTVDSGRAAAGCCRNAKAASMRLITSTATIAWRVIVLPSLDSLGLILRHPVGGVTRRRRPGARLRNVYRSNVSTRWAWTVVSRGARTKTVKRPSWEATRAMASP